MPEPLTDEQLRKYREQADGLLEINVWSDAYEAHTNEESSNAITVLLAEVERLKAREADLVADLEMIRGGLVKRINDMGDEMARDFGGYPEEAL